MSFFAPDTFTAAIEAGCSLEFLKALDAAGVDHDEKTLDAAILRGGIEVISLFIEKKVSALLNEFSARSDF